MVRDTYHQKPVRTRIQYRGRSLYRSVSKYNDASGTDALQAVRLRQLRISLLLRVEMRDIQYRLGSTTDHLLTTLSTSNQSASSSLTWIDIIDKVLASRLGVDDRDGSTTS